MRRTLLRDAVVSTPGLWKRLKRSPLLIGFIDEMGDELAKIWAGR